MMASSSNIEWTDATWTPVVGCTRASAACDNCYAVEMTHRLGAMAEADERAGRDPGRKANYRGLTVLNPRGDRHFNGKVRCVPEALGDPFKWRRSRRVFVSSMSDIFHEAVPFDFLDRIFAVMALCPQHTFQVLTKRPARMAEYLTHGEHNNRCGRVGTIADQMRSKLPWNDPGVGPLGHGVPGHPWWPLPNVWLGTTTEDQATADERIPHLLRCPAALRFLSCEPLLREINLGEWINLSHPFCPECGHPDADHADEGRPVGCQHDDGEAVCGCRRLRGEGRHRSRGEPMHNHAIHWIIAGGEQAERAKARDTPDEWYRSLREQCAAAGVPFFLKQRTLHGKKIPMVQWPADLRVQQMPVVQGVGA